MVRKEVEKLLSERLNISQHQFKRLFDLKSDAITKPLRGAVM